MPRRQPSERRLLRFAVHGTMFAKNSPCRNNPARRDRGTTICQ